MELTGSVSRNSDMDWLRVDAARKAASTSGDSATWAPVEQDGNTDEESTMNKDQSNVAKE